MKTIDVRPMDAPGSAYRITPGHDAWVVGDEAVVGLEFESKTAETYGRT
jgi:hypothetical protein